MLNSNKEKGCFAVTAERKYYEVGRTFVKRSLRPREWQVTFKGTIHMPRQGKERLLNEAGAMQFVRERAYKSPGSNPVLRIYRRRCSISSHEVRRRRQYGQSH